MPPNVLKEYRRGGPTPVMADVRHLINVSPHQRVTSSPCHLINALTRDGCVLSLCGCALN